MLAPVGGGLQELGEVGRSALGAASKADKLLAGSDLALALRESTGEAYSSLRRPWPGLLREVAASELPARVLERLGSAPADEVMQCACGVFPEIRRAWVTVDNNLYLWRFDARGGEHAPPVEYSEEQVICAVALVAPKRDPPVFPREVKHLLVLATPVEVVLLGVCVSAEHGLDELKLQALPLYAIPSDAVAMRCIKATAAGRIFMGGHDGHLYELEYNDGGGRWRERRMRKVCHSATLSSYLPTFMQLASPDPIVEIAIDEARGVLYTRSAGSALVVYDLGERGDKCAKVAECSSGRVATQLGNSTKLLGMFTVSGQTSQGVQLATMATDGTRAYWSVFPKQGYSSSLTEAQAAKRRPSTLHVVITRQPPPEPQAISSTAGGLMPDSVLAVRSSTMNVQCALLTESEAVFAGPGTGGQARLMIAARDWTYATSGAAPLPVAINGGIGPDERAARPRGYRELVAEVQAASAVLGVAEVPTIGGHWELVEPLADRTGGAVAPSVAAARAAALPELVSQHALPRSQLVVVTQTGVRLFERLRPIDTLAALLEAGDMEGVRWLFNDYGQAEACGMCLALATGACAHVGSAGARATIEKAAADLWYDAALCGTARVEEAMDARAGPAGATGGFDMGRTVREPSLVFSGAYRGACSYAARVLRAVWDVPLAVAGSGDAQALSCPLARARGDGGMPLATLEAAFIVPLQRLLAQRVAAAGGAGGDAAGSNGGAGGPMRRARRAVGQITSATDATAEEVSRMAALAALLARTAEAMALLQLLPGRNFARLAQRLPGARRDALRRTTFGELVCTPEGDELARSLAEAFLKEASDGAPGSSGGMERAAHTLRSRCPTFFGEAEKVGAQALSLLAMAKAAKANGAAGEAAERARRAVDLLRGAPRSRAVPGACAALEQLGEYEGLVELALRAAEAAGAELPSAAGGGDAGGGGASQPTSPVGARSPLAPTNGVGAGAAAGAAGAAAAAAAFRGERVAECYALVTDALERLAWRADGGKGSEAEVAAARARLLAAALGRGGAGGAVAPRAFHDALYAAMLRAGMRAELLNLDATLRGTGASAAFLDAFLLDAGGGAARLHAVARPLVATAEEASHLEALARLYAARGRPGDAAWVLHRLAFRAAGGGGDGNLTSAISLDERRALLSQALLHARSVSAGPIAGAYSGGASAAAASGADPAAAAPEIEDKLEVLGFQLRLARELSADARAATVVGADALRVLREEPLPVSALYNDYAAPLGMHGVMLEILAFTRAGGGAHADDARELWDEALAEAYTAAAASAGAAASASAGTAAAAERAAELSSALWAPASAGAGAEAALPLAHVALRLEQLGAGAWPTSGAAALGVTSSVSIPLVASLRSKPGGAEALVGAYGALLARAGGELAAPSLRLRVLRGAADAMRAWREEAAVAEGARGGATGAGTSGARQPWLAGGPAAGARAREERARVAQLAERYALEARSLTPAADAEAVAARLDAIARAP